MTAPPPLLTVLKENAGLRQSLHPVTGVFLTLAAPKELGSLFPPVPPDRIKALRRHVIPGNLESLWANYAYESMDMGPCLRPEDWKWCRELALFFKGTTASVNLTKFPRSGGKRQWATQLLFTHAPERELVFSHGEEKDAAVAHLFFAAALRHSYFGLELWRDMQFVQKKWCSLESLKPVLLQWFQELRLYTERDNGYTQLLRAWQTDAGLPSSWFTVVWFMQHQFMFFDPSQLVFLVSDILALRAPGPTTWECDWHCDPEIVPLLTAAAMCIVNDAGQRQALKDTLIDSRTKTERKEWFSFVAALPADLHEYLEVIAEAVEEAARRDAVREKERKKRLGRKEPEEEEEDV
jgi:hypothetical protein